jgi:hypothetical protein
VLLLAATAQWIALAQAPVLVAQWIALVQAVSTRAAAALGVWELAAVALAWLCRRQQLLQGASLAGVVMMTRIAAWSHPP